MRVKNNKIVFPLILVYKLAKKRDNKCFLSTISVQNSVKIQVKRTLFNKKNSLRLVPYLSRIIFQYRNH